MLTQLPAKATFEADLAGGVALYDVSDLLPRHSTKRYGRRGGPVKRLYIHHSGKLGAPGFAGARNSARYLVSQRGWPGAAYHFWAPYEPLRDGDGRLVLLRLQPDTIRSWHTGGRANGHGIGLALQGNTTARPMSDSQVELLEAAIPWLCEAHGLDAGADGLSWHAEADRFGGHKKPTCPGAHATAWLEAYRRGAAT